MWRAMKIRAVLSFLVLGFAVPTPASADDEGTPAELAAIKVARAWHAAMIDSPSGTVEVSKEQPLDYVLERVPTKSCKGLARGRATTAPAVLKLKKCLMDTRKALGTEPPTADFRAFPIDEAIGGFDRKQRKSMKELAKDATVILSQYLGDGLTMNVSLVIAADGKVRAAWVDYGEFE
jgi:hypothetical protein